MEPTRWRASGEARDSEAYRYARKFEQLQDVSHVVEGDRNGTPVAGACACGCRVPAPVSCNGEYHKAKMKLHVESKANGPRFVIVIRSSLFPYPKKRFYAMFRCGYVHKNIKTSIGVWLKRRNERMINLAHTTFESYAFRFFQMLFTF